MTFVVVAVSAVSLMSLFMAGADACNKVPTLTWSDACLKVSSTPAMYNLCQETLQRSPETAEATVYAAAAAEAATASYGDTASAALELLMFGGLGADERQAVKTCLSESSWASDRMLRVIDDMNTCRFRYTAGEYDVALWSVESCGDALSGFPRSPLVAKNAADLAVTQVAVQLGSLVVELQAAI